MILAVASEDVRANVFPGGWGGEVFAFGLRREYV